MDSNQEYWSISQEISQALNWDEPAICSTIKLFDDDNTIPFIARYRKAVTNDMTPEILREVKQKHEELKAVKEKVLKVLNSNKTNEKMTPKIEQGLKYAKTMVEVELFSSTFKTESKKTLSERAKQLGLESTAVRILESPKGITEKSIISKHLDISTKGLANTKEIFVGLRHLLADRIHKDSRTIKRVRSLCGQNERKTFGDFTIECSAAKPPAAKSSDSKAEQAKNKEQAKRAVDASKFTNFIDKTFSINRIQSHQVLAINRGESLKVLSVKFTLSEQERSRFANSLKEHWLKPYRHGDKLHELMTQSIDDALKRLIEPLIIRQAR